MESQSQAPVTLKNLSQKHKEAVSLICQGVSRGDVATICGFVPEYITWLMRQEVCKEYLKEIMEVVDFRMVAMTEQSVDAIQEVLKDGSGEDRLKAAKLQLEAVGRIGAGKNAQPIAPPAPDHFEMLAQRIVGLLKSTRTGATIEGQSQVVQE